MSGQEQRQGSHTTTVQQFVGTGNRFSTFVMFLPGLRIKTLRFDVDIDKNPSEKGRNTLDFYLEAPSGEKASVTPRSDISHKFHHHGVNGMWFLHVVPSSHFHHANEASDAFIHTWTLDFADTHQVTTIHNYGTVSTIIGNGSYNGKQTKPSRSGQSALSSMGGRSWGVAFNAKGTFFYNSTMDQNYIAKWIPGSSTNSESESNPIRSQKATIQHVKQKLKTPMVMDFSPVSDDLYVACYNGPYIARLTADTDYTKQTNLLKNKVKGPMAARFGQHSQTKLYVADTKQHRILEYDTESGKTRTVAGTTGVKGYAGDGGNATKAKLNYPIDIDVDTHGVLVIADGMNNRLRAVNMDASKPHILGGITIMPGKIETIAGRNPPDLKAKSPMDTHPQPTYNFTTEEQGIRATQAHINWPVCPRVDSVGRIWFFDADNHRLRVVERAGLISTIGGNAGPDQIGFRLIGTSSLSSEALGNGQSPLHADFNRVMDISVQQVAPGKYNVYLGDTDNCMIRKITGIEFIEYDAQSYLDRRTTDLRVTTLKDAGLVTRQNESSSEIQTKKNSQRKKTTTTTTYVGMVSYIKNFGNVPAPGEAIGSVNVLYTLEDLSGTIVSAGNKGPVFLSNSHENDDQFYDDGFRFPHTKYFSATRPGGVDIYPVSSNANTPIDHVPDGVYIYTQRLDPYGDYPYQMFVPTPRHAILYLSSSSKGNRSVTQLSPYDLTQKRMQEWYAILSSDAVRSPNNKGYLNRQSSYDATLSTLRMITSSSYEKGNNDSDSLQANTIVPCRGCHASASKDTRPTCTKSQGKTTYSDTTIGIMMAVIIVLVVLLLVFTTYGSANSNPSSISEPTTLAYRNT